MKTRFTKIEYSLIVKESQNSLNRVAVEHAHWIWSSKRWKNEKFLKTLDGLYKVMERFPRYDHAKTMS
jgi:hypothetical protein